MHRSWMDMCFRLIGQCPLEDTDNERERNTTGVLQRPTSELCSVIESNITPILHIWLSTIHVPTIKYKHKGTTFQEPHSFVLLPVPACLFK